MWFRCRSSAWDRTAISMRCSPLRTGSASFATTSEVRDDKTNNALYMDAFARLGHVGLLWTAVMNTDGTYQFAEAKGDSYGVHVYSETWMKDSNYVGVRRKNWTPDCYPNCAASAGSVV